MSWGMAPRLRTGTRATPPPRRRLSGESPARCSGGDSERPTSGRRALSMPARASGGCDEARSAARTNLPGQRVGLVVGRSPVNGINRSSTLSEWEIAGNDAGQCQPPLGTARRGRGRALWGSPSASLGAGRPCPLCVPGHPSPHAERCVALSTPYGEGPTTTRRPFIR